MKKAILLALKVGITSALLWMIFREHRFTTEIVPQLALMKVHWPWVVAGLASVGVSTWLGALRWQVLLVGQEHPMPAWTVLRVTIISNFFNITSLGAAGGDAYRVLALMRHPGARRLPVLVSVLLDHLVGLVGLAVLFFSCAAVFWRQWDSYGPQVRTLVEAFSIFMAASLLFVLLSAISFTPRLYSWGERRFGWMLSWPPLKQFAQACDGLRRAWRCSLLATVLSVLIFLTHFLSFYCGIHAVGGAAALLDVLAAMPIVDAAAGLPISVSGLGVREKTFETLMSALSGIPEATAVSASLAGWLMGVVWGLLGGVLFLCGGRATPAPGAPAAACTP
jgi:uncharacterized membrane protein YbhN (UPF0104 family)